MKTFIFMIAFCCVLAAKEKAYVPQNNIFFQDNLIWIAQGDRCVPVSRISSDANGLYVTDEDVLGFWECTRCGKLNPPWNFLACDRCGNSK